MGLCARLQPLDHRVIDVPDEDLGYVAASVGDSAMIDRTCRLPADAVAGGP